MLGIAVAGTVSSLQYKKVGRDVSTGARFLFD